jgi:hypothetical protein
VEVAQRARRSSGKRALRCPGRGRNRKNQKSHTRAELAALLKEFRKVDEEFFPL